MTITWIDGFDLYNSAGVLPGASGKYTTDVPGHPKVTTGRFGGQAMMFDANNGISFFAAAGLGAGADTVTVGFALRMNGGSISSDANRRILWFYNGSTAICTLSVDVDGAIRFYRGDNGTLLGSSAAGVITGENWYYVECALTRDAAAGIVLVNVNGVEVLNLTGQNTGASAITSLRFCRVQNLGGSAAILFDDLYVKNDVSGFLGEVRVETLRPSADTADKDWAASTGTDNFALVDETVENSDTDYVSSATVGHKDIYDVGALSSSPAVIHAVQSTIVARKDDATAREVAARVKSDASVDGATHQMSSGYNFFSDIAPLDPDGAVAWTAAAVNAAQLEIEVIS